MIVLGLRINAARWPWQDGYDWKASKATAPLNPSGARFGGGWKYSLGIEIGGKTVILNLVYGMVKITQAARCAECARYIDGRTGPYKSIATTDGGTKSGWDMHRECFDRLAAVAAEKERKMQERQTQERAARQAKHWNEIDIDEDIPF